MKLLTPMRAIQGNLLLTKNGSCWAYYHVPAVTLANNDTEARAAYKRELMLIFKELGKFHEVHCQLIPQDLRLRERFDELEKDFDEEMLDIGKRYNERTISVLKEELEQTTEYAFLIGVKLKSQLLTSEQGVQDSVVRAVDSVTSKALTWLHVEVDSTKQDFAYYAESEKEVYHILGTILATRVEEERIFFLSRYNFIRGFDCDYQEEISRSGLDISDTVIDPSKHAGVLSLTGENGESSFVSFVVIEKTKLDLSYEELFEHVQGYPFPVEFHIKARTIKKSTIRRKIMFTGTRYKETDKEMFNNEDTDDTIIDGKIHLNELRNEINNDQVPFFEWLACFAVTGKTRKEVNQRVKTIQTDLKRRNIKSSQPLADQLPLFYKFLHGQPLDVKELNWMQSSTNEVLAEFCIGLSHQLGSHIGNYFGRVTKGVAKSSQDAVANSRAVVLFHSFLANEGILGATTDSPHIAVAGSTGNGKSFLIKMILLYLSFLKSYLLMADPKAEVKKWFLEARNKPEIQKEYPEFVKLIDKINFVTLNPDNPDNLGVLDPINFLVGARARDTILTIFETIISDQDTRTENEIRKAVDFVLNRKEQGEAVGTMQVIEVLEAHEDEQVRLVGENMRLKVRNSSLQLLFSNGTTRSIRVDDKITVIEIEGLDLPSAGTNTKDQTESERNAVAVMIALAKFCEYFGMRDKSKNTTIIVDEAWVLTTAKGGSKLLKSLRRVGRSYKNQLILVTQSVADIEREDDTGNFGACFFFDENSERSQILKALDMEVNEDNKNQLRDLKKGQCIFKDFYGRKEQLSIDCLFPEWVTAFKTVDKSNSARAERMFA